jgi:hypothetical protein
MSCSGLIPWPRSAGPTAPTAWEMPSDPRRRCHSFERSTGFSTVRRRSAVRPYTSIPVSARRGDALPLGSPGLLRRKLIGNPSHQVASTRQTG